MADGLKAGVSRSGEPHDERLFSDRARLLDLASGIVATQGWDRLTTRRLAAAAGHRSNSVIAERYGFTDETLRLMLVQFAFGDIVVALEPVAINPAISGPDQFKLLAQHLREHPDAASLMAQIAARASLIEPEFARTLAAEFAARRQQTIQKIAPLQNGPGGFRAPEGSLGQARRVVNWYIAASALLTSDPCLSEDNLIALALV